MKPESYYQSFQFDSRFVPKLLDLFGEIRMSNVNLLSTTESNAERKGTLRRKSDCEESGEGVLR